MFSLSLTTTKMFAVKLCNAFSLTIKMGKNLMCIAYVNRKPKYDLLFDGKLTFSVSVTISGKFNLEMCDIDHEL